MKKNFLSLIFAFAILCSSIITVSCTKNNETLKEYSPDELEYFEGKVLIGTTWSKSGKKKYFILKDPETQQQWSTEVSLKTFDMYKLGDTIKITKPIIDESNLDSIQDKRVTIINQGNHEYVMTIEHSPNCKCLKNE